VPEADRWWFTQVFPVARSLEFWLGVAAAELMLRGLWRGPGLRLASAIFVVTWVVTTQWIPAGFWTTVLAAVYILVITSAARADIRGAWSPWRSRPMVWLGEVSFAFYLVHVFVVLSILRETGYPRGLPGWQGPAAAVGFLLLNLLLAWLLFRFVETPMTRLLKPRRRSARPASRPAVDSAPAVAPVGAPTVVASAERPAAERPVAVPRPRVARSAVAREDHDSRPRRTGDLAPDRA
jgi:peptidoglycan/LPS O-acetylase OafA/YrhL